MIDLDQKTPTEVACGIAERVRARRKERKLTQAEMSRKAGVSLGSYKRFEQEGLISLDSLVKVAIALGCEDDFESLFAQRSYASIQDVIAESARP